MLETADVGQGAMGRGRWSAGEGAHALGVGVEGGGCSRVAFTGAAARGNRAMRSRMMFLGSALLCSGYRAGAANPRAAAAHAPACACGVRVVSVYCMRACVANGYHVCEV